MVRKNRHGSNSIKSPIKAHDDPRVLPPDASLRSRGTMRDALRSPAHQRAPEPDTRQSVKLTLRPSRAARPLQKSTTLPSLRRGLAPLDKNMPPIPRPDFPVETDLFARTENVSLRRALGLHALPAPAIDTTCEQDSATGAGQRHSWPLATPTVCSDTEQRGSYTEQRGSDTEQTTPRSSAWRLIELSPALNAGRENVFLLPNNQRQHRTSHAPTGVHAGSDLHAGAIDQFRRLTEEDMERHLEDLTQELETLHVAEEAKAAARLEKDKRELLLLFARRRDAGFIVDVSESSPAPVRVISR